MITARFDPFRELAHLQGRMNRVFGDTYVRDEDVTARGSWMPPVDIFETDNHDLVIRAELPGMLREDIEVTVERNTLTLKGAKKPAEDVKDEQYRRIERNYGTFTRSFTLPDTVDAAAVGAEFKHGVLTVKLPFRTEARPRSITVEVAA